MSACTFFGHRDCPSSIKSKLRKVLIDLIESHAVDMFYVGQQGAFDSMVRSVLKELVKRLITRTEKGSAVVGVSIYSSTAIP